MEKTVQTIIKGETLLVSAKAVRGDKVQLEFAEIISNPYNKARSGGLVSMLNKSDDRFGSSARRGWITGEPSDISELLGIDFSDLAYGTVKELNVLNPEIGGDRCRLQITETTVPDAYQTQNLETTAKKAGADGDFIMHNGLHIFSNVDVGLQEAEHVFLKPDSDQSAAEEVAASTAEITV